jgi:hypothetical protein
VGFLAATNLRVASVAIAVFSFSEQGNTTVFSESLAGQPEFRRLIGSDQKIYCFIISQLNRCMYKRDLQREIQRSEERDTKQADAWLEAEGFSPKMYSLMDIELLKTQRTAHHCLKHHSQLLSNKDVDVINRFLESMSKRHTRRRIKPTRIHQVMNRGNGINRR